MLRSLFGSSDESWSDRAKAHKQSLREKQQLSREADPEAIAEAKANDRGARRASGVRKGFGKRN